MRTAPRDGGDKAGAVQGQGEGEVVLGVGQGGQAQASARGVLEVRAHVGDLLDAHFEGLMMPVWDSCVAGEREK